MVSDTVPGSLAGREDTMTPREPHSPDHSGEPGPTARRLIVAPVPDVWAVLADGWSYATWVVGASRVRDVDTAWPAVGSRIQHSFGVWPLVIDDSTRVDEVRHNRELILTARGWPAGEARVHLSLRPIASDRCEVTITEDAVTGPGLLIPPLIRRLILVPRNREALHRLALLAEGRRRLKGAHHPEQPGHGHEPAQP